jgi:hypothetical protein
VVLVPWEYAARMGELRACTPVATITDERAGYLLEVLPPMDWHRQCDCESWAMSEFETGRVTCQVVRLGRAWYAFNAPIMRHAARVRWVLYALAEACAVEAPSPAGA